MSREQHSDDKLREAMTFPDEETILRVFGAPISHAFFTGFSKVNARPATMDSEVSGREEKFRGRTDVTKVLKSNGDIPGYLVEIPQHVHSIWYRRFLYTDQWPRRCTGRDRPIELLHAFQGVTWCPAWPWDDLMKQCPQPSAPCAFLAVTQNSKNMTYDAEDTVNVGEIALNGRYMCNLPYPNDIIVAWIATVPLWDPPPPLSNPIHPAWMMEKFLDPCYALDLPHKEIDGWLWAIDVDALDKALPVSTTPTEINWEPDANESEATGFGT